MADALKKAPHEHERRVDLEKLDKDVQALGVTVTRLSADVDGESRIFSKRNLIIFFLVLIPVATDFALMTQSQRAQAQTIEKLQTDQDQLQTDVTEHKLAPAPHPVVDASTRAILEALARVEAGQAQQNVKIEIIVAEQKKTTRYVDRLCDKNGITCQ